MTLIEVVAGLVILGTILASVAIARGRFARQWSDADHKLAASKALDAMVTGWMDTTPPQVPLNRQGDLPDARGCIWRTRVLRDPAATSLGAAVVRVEVFERGTEKGAPLPLISVDLLLHVTPRRAATRPSAEAKEAR